MPDLSADCVIVGGGIGGAVLGLALGRAGQRVLILEKDLKPEKAGRPEILAKATIDIFHKLGVGEKILEESAIPLKGLELWQSAKSRPLLCFSQDDFVDDIQPYSTDPARTREILLKAAQAHGTVTVMRGVQVGGLLREGSRTVGVRAVRDGRDLVCRASLVVGDDGGMSVVRRTLGIPILTKELPVVFLGCAGPILDKQREGVGEAWVHPRGLKSGLAAGVFMPQVGGRSACVFLLSPKAFARFTEAGAQTFFEAARRLSPLCEGLEERMSFPSDFTHFRRPFGHASRYTSDGAVLIGDAAHPVTPAGGQGANMSVADAFALANVVLKCRGSISSADLNAYQRERWPANQRSVEFSVRANQIFRFVGFMPWLIAPFLWYLRHANRVPETKRRFLRAVSTAFRSIQKQETA